jgi:hypothetical protein
MAVEQLVIKGTVRDGVVVPDAGEHLPEGARVDIVLSLQDLPPELLAETKAWERASDEAWAMIDAWEKEAAE